MPPPRLSATTSMDRRQFLARTLGAASGVIATQVASGCAGLESPPEGSYYVDGHVHVWTPDTTAYPLAPHFSKKNMAPPSFTPDELFAQCRPQGVKRIVLIQMSFYEFDNRYMLDAIRNHPGVFRGVGIVDDAAARPQDAMKELASHGVRGFRVRADQQQTPLWASSPGMKAMWSYAADAGLSICPLADPEVLPLIHGMCKQYPRTSVVIDHFARVGMKGPVRQGDLDNLCRLAEFPSTHVKTSAFYALGKKKAPYSDVAPLVRSLRDAYGAQRLIWGSDCPFQVQNGHTYADSIAVIRDRLDFLTVDDKAWMLRKSAESVFFT